MNAMDIADECLNAEEKAHSALRECGLAFNSPASKNSDSNPSAIGYSPYYVSCNYGAAENIREVRITGILYGVSWLTKINLVKEMFKHFPKSGFKVLPEGGLNCILMRFERDDKNSAWRQVI